MQVFFRKRRLVAVPAPVLQDVRLDVLDFLRGGVDVFGEVLEDALHVFEGVEELVRVGELLLRGAVEGLVGGGLVQVEEGLDVLAG